jgi:hypothetical protein
MPIAADQRIPEFQIYYRLKYHVHSGF